MLVVQPSILPVFQFICPPFASVVFVFFNHCYLQINALKLQVRNCFIVHSHSLQLGCCSYLDILLLLCMCLPYKFVFAFL